MGFARIGWAFFVVAALVGCWDNDPCDAGQIFKDGVCFQAPSASGGSTSSGGQTGDAGSGGDSSGPAQPDSWAKQCTQPADCTGNSPICAPAPLGYCTNINCSPGEANEGICPAGWTCFPAGGGNPSACLKL
ncbi:MAG TPA: hypothetical protein VFQ35_25320 [Polyangiaceae bacterium]|nr:hypothetical protein [Polyangiaceae bacterium]